jgi:hypothetical protein
VQKAAEVLVDEIEVEEKSRNAIATCQGKSTAA